ncbi:MAG: NAD-dependent epimerase/dehydratase family protein, partial [Planctomycetaceae bacterium]|nr:NAD-dependent epimerase/dehydratase family protein [Planctomycetaceae bacterium]
MTGQHWSGDCDINAPVEFTFNWHEQPAAFERLIPPWEPVQLARREGSIHNGDVTELLVGHWPLQLRWVARHENYRPPHEFVDVQTSGPFASWRHSHQFSPGKQPQPADSAVQAQCRLTDSIEYRLPLGWLGQLAGRRMVQRKLDRMFRWRHHITRHDVAALWRAAADAKAKEKATMRILISGASGLVGSDLVSYLKGGGHELVALSRSSSTNGMQTITWDPASGQLDTEAVSGFDAVVHLAGEGIASGRWNEARKRRIRDSRVNGTRLLSNALAACSAPPKVMVCASAIGYYGDRGNETLTENS